MDLIEAMKGRHSVRAYLDKPVPQEVVEAVLEAARFAPSGVNTQPWRVAVVDGEAKVRLGAALEAARRGGVEPDPDYHYYPEQWREPYQGRRVACGKALYGALDIGRGDRERQLDAWCANYRFFDAPLGLLFFMDRDMGRGSWLDMGMFMQNVMLAARAHGLESCPQASLADYPKIVRRELGLEEDRLLLAGLALGYADASAPVNGYRLDREPVPAFTTWHR
ncbi:nitroreductase [Endothiovibrio diazotrophicus]